MGPTPIGVARTGPILVGEGKPADKIGNEERKDQERSLLPEGWRDCIGPASIGVARTGPKLLGRGKLTDRISNEEDAWL